MTMTTANYLKALTAPQTSPSYLVKTPSFPALKVVSVEVDNEIYTRAEDGMVTAIFEGDVDMREAHRLFFEGEGY